MREIVESSFLKEFTQGSVFNGVKIRDVDRYGVVITARCDIEQDKVGKINYLVVTPLNDWWDEEGRGIVYSRSQAKILQEISKILKKHNISEDVLGDYPERIFLEMVKGRSKADGEALEELFSLSSDNIMEFDFSWVKGNKKAVLKDLFAQRLNGYYFLEDIDPHGSGEGYVIDLRMPMTASIEFAREAKVGIEKDEVLNGTGCGDVVSIPDGGIVMFFSCIKSPYIEHILQCFANTFSRIGLQDIDKSYVESKIGDYAK